VKGRGRPNSAGESHIISHNKKRGDKQGALLAGMWGEKTSWGDRAVKNEKSVHSTTIFKEEPVLRDDTTEKTPLARLQIKVSLSATRLGGRKEQKITSNGRG